MNLRDVPPAPFEFTSLTGSEALMELMRDAPVASLDSSDVPMAIDTDFIADLSTPDFAVPAPSSAYDMNPAQVTQDFMSSIYSSAPPVNVPSPRPSEHDGLSPSRRAASVISEWVAQDDDIPSDASSHTRAFGQRIRQNEPIANLPDDAQVTKGRRVPRRSAATRVIYRDKVDESEFPDLDDSELDEYVQRGRANKRKRANKEKKPTKRARARGGRTKRIAIPDYSSQSGEASRAQQSSPLSEVNKSPTRPPVTMPVPLPPRIPLPIVVTNTSLSKEKTDPTKIPGYPYWGAEHAENPPPFVSQPIPEPACGLHQLKDPPPGERPPYNYTTLIKHAILGSPQKKLRIDGILEQLMGRFEYFRNAEKKLDKGWKNSVRHHLTLSAVFVKKEKEVYESGRGIWWTVDESVAESELTRERKRRPRSKAARLAAAEKERKQQGLTANPVLDKSLVGPPSTTTSPQLLSARSSEPLPLFVRAPMQFPSASTLSLTPGPAALPTSSTSQKSSTISVPPRLKHTLPRSASPDDSARPAATDSHERPQSTVFVPSNSMETKGTTMYPTDDSRDSSASYTPDSLRDDSIPSANSGLQALSIAALSSARLPELSLPNRSSMATSSSATVSLVPQQSTAPPFVPRSIPSSSSSSNQDLSAASAQDDSPPSISPSSSAPSKARKPTRPVNATATDCDTSTRLNNPLISSSNPYVSASSGSILTPTVQFRPRRALPTVTKLPVIIHSAPGTKNDNFERSSTQITTPSIPNTLFRRPSPTAINLPNDEKVIQSKSSDGTTKMAIKTTLDPSPQGTSAASTANPFLAPIHPSLHRLSQSSTVSSVVSSRQHPSAHPAALAQPGFGGTPSKGLSASVEVSRGLFHPAIKKKEKESPRREKKKKVKDRTMSSIRALPTTAYGSMTSALPLNSTRWKPSNTAVGPAAFRVTPVVAPRKEAELEGEGSEDD